MFEIQDRLIGFYIWNPACFEMVFDVDESDYEVIWNCAKGQTFAALRNDFMTTLGRDLVSLNVMADGVLVQEHELIEKYVGRYVVIRLPCWKYDFVCGRRRARAVYCPFVRIWQIRGGAAPIYGGDMDFARYFVHGCELEDDVLLAELDLNEPIEIRRDTRDLIVHSKTRSDRLRDLLVCHDVNDVKNSYIKHVARGRHQNSFFLEDHVSSLPFPNSLRVFELPDQVNLNTELSGGFRFIVIVDGEPIAHPIARDTRAGYVKRALGLERISVADDTILFDVSEDVTGERYEKDQAKSKVSQLLRFLLSQAPSGPQKTMRDAKAILLFSFLGIPADRLRLEDRGRAVDDGEVMGGERNIMSRLRWTISAIAE